ncbi:hypothetical protein QAD02_022125 [Eretmocerus hayati]|uniref:Uncharacterized protein n=1 Tax=Eretmocerus hayati TaxID=131215 RepID=A0ACC2PS32_9HYME|nr:hypothetical protein QAD02_022125 [Eretmocerus hayati]
MSEQIPNNLLMFQAALSNCFHDVAQCVSEEEYLEIFTTIKQSVVKRLHKTMNENLSKALDEDLKDLTAEECVVEGMKKIAELSEETNTPSNVELWRPPGDVLLHLRSLDAQKMEKECKNLEMFINVTEKENEILMNKLMKERKTIQCVSDHMKQLCNMPFKLSELENVVRSNQEYAETLQDES